MSQNQSPSWPSLYNPAVDLIPVAHEAAVQPRGVYLYNVDDIFRFTFYWTLIFYIPVFVLCGIIAFINIAFAPNPYKNRLYPQTQFFYLFGSRFRLLRNNIRLRKASRATEETEEHPLALSTFSSAASPTSTTPFVPNVFPSADTRNFNSQGLSSPTPHSVLGTAHPSASSLPSSRRLPPRPKTNVHRTRAVYALLVLLFFFASGLLGAVIGSAVVGYLLAALYKAGNFNMSTWIPVIFALVQTLVAFLGIYPSIAEII
ncbi:integral membrane [Pyrrhoderma noxium]|uniref:Integral membrane n=1 Tax=Pyrrhoderma noxium TaxID=2282107 RepID=A0A286UK33_9AGAM|nr:integral membrane [Pyrrhoderma noxium]